MLKLYPQFLSTYNVLAYTHHTFNILYITVYSHSVGQSLLVRIAFTIMHEQSYCIKVNGGRWWCCKVKGLVVDPFHRWNGSKAFALQQTGNHRLFVWKPVWCPDLKMNVHKHYCTVTLSAELSIELKFFKNKGTASRKSW